MLLDCGHEPVRQTGPGGVFCRATTVAHGKTTSLRTPHSPQFSSVHPPENVQVVLAGWRGGGDQTRGCPYVSHARYSTSSDQGRSDGSLHRARMWGERSPACKQIWRLSGRLPTTPTPQRHSETKAWNTITSTAAALWSWPSTSSKSCSGIAKAAHRGSADRLGRRAARTGAHAQWRPLRHIDSRAREAAENVGYRRCCAPAAGSAAAGRCATGGEPAAWSAANA